MSSSSSSSSSETKSMWWDIGLQALMFLIGGLFYLYSNDIPRKLLSKFHSYRHRHRHLARQHFVKSASLLSKARSSSPPLSSTLAAAATTEADAAISFDPSDAAHHIVKALALDFQGYKTSALESIEIALSPLAVKSLAEDELADAMLKRAELRMEVKGEDFEVVERELREVVKMKTTKEQESGRVWCLLGECCEKLGKVEQAREAFREAVRVEPACVAAIKGLERLG